MKNLKKALDFLKIISAILTAIIMIGGQLGEIFEGINSLSDIFKEEEKNRADECEYIEEEE